MQAAFGPLHFEHLQRSDVIGQAVSWARAEQTGYWQRGDRTLRTPEPDVARMVQISRTIQTRNAAWRAWFKRNEIEPHELDYANLIRRPATALGEIGALVGLSQVQATRPDDLPRQQADEVNAEWSALLRDALTRDDR